MAPRKKADKVGASIVHPPPTNAVGDSSDDDALSQYSEVQRDEYLATQAIYPDGFVRIHGRKEAWKNHENLAFQVRLTSYDNTDYSVVLDVEFPKEYPKVSLKARIASLSAELENFRAQLDSIIRDISKSQLGSECVYELTAAIEDVLNRTARSKAEKVNPLSLEEERARREAAEKLQIQQLEDEKRQQEERARRELLLAIDSEPKRINAAINKSRPYEIMAEFDFEQELTLRIEQLNHTFTFSKVDARILISGEPDRSDKDVRLATPIINDNGREWLAPARLFLKVIKLPKTLNDKEVMHDAMRSIEDYLHKLSTATQPEVDRIIGYKICYPHGEIQNKYEIWVLTEMAMRSLASVVYWSRGLESEFVRNVTRHMLNALAFYSSRDSIHPSVHAANVLLYDTDLDRRGLPAARIADGYGIQLRKLVDETRDLLDESPRKHMAVELPPKWTAPELYGQHGECQETALWNLGVIVMEMVLGSAVTKFFTSPSDCLARVELSASFKDFLTILFQHAPRGRSNPEALQGHTFLFQKEELVKEGQDGLMWQISAAKDQNAESTRWKREWQVEKSLGKGGFGRVYQARKLFDQQIYAVKRITVSEKNRQYFKDLRAEVMTLAHLQHPFIVRYFDAWDEDIEEVQDLGYPDESEQPDSSSDDITNDVAYAVPKSLTNANEEVASMYDSLVKNMGRSLPQGPGFVPSYKKLGQGPDEEDDEEEESSSGQYDNSEDYDNAFNNGNAAIDSKELKNDGGFDDVFGNGNAPVDPKELQNETSTDGRKAPARVAPRGPSIITKGNFYIQMEFCKGRTLTIEILSDLCNKPDRMWRIFRGVLDGLRYIHKNGITHRDLKPENIFIMDEDGTPKIGDFGLATAIKARETGGSEVGTTLYIAPEILNKTPIEDLQKTDMYSMGIIFFEMNTRFPTYLQRAEEVFKIRNHPPTLPPKFSHPDYATHKTIILDLLARDPKKRPTAADLLNRSDIPEPIELDKVQRFFNHILQTDPTWVTSRIKIPKTTDLQDLRWNRALPTSDDSLPVVFDDLRARLCRIFRKHGAVESNRQPLVPRASYFATDAVRLLEEEEFGRLQLVQDVTTPFARSIAKSRPQYPKYYSFDSSFQVAPGYSTENEPQQTLEANFDCVSFRTTDLALKEATTIYLVKDIIDDIPALSYGKWAIMINHMDLLDIILKACHVRPETWLKVKDSLSQIRHMGVRRDQQASTWQAMEKLLQKDLGIEATSVALLRQYAFLYGNTDHLRTILKKAFGQSGAVAYNEALAILRRLDDVVENLNRLNFGIKLFVVPLFSFRAHLYDGSIAFQCIERSVGGVLASGGRYDGLVAHHQRASSSNDAPPVRAVGLRVGLQDLVSLVENLGGESSTSRPSRVGVLVTSFDAKLLGGPVCLDVVSRLWAAGLAAELTEEVESMDALEAMHAHDGPYWLVIVRMGPEAVPLLKIRGPEGGEREGVSVEGVAGELVVELGRRAKRG